MPVDRKPIFNAVKSLRGGKGWVQADVDFLDRAIDAATGEVTARFRPTAPAAPPAASPVLPGPPSPGTPGTFRLSETSLGRLAVCHPKLRQCIELAILRSTVDFGVGETERSKAQQVENVKKGVSRTMKSKHFKQADGKVWAADLIAYVAGKVSWDLVNYAAIAMAMDKAATELGIADHIRWGCAWDRVLSDFGGKAEAYFAEILAYQKRHAGSDLLDGPHFEWVP